MGAGVCDECGQPSRERVETLTGRLVCPTCQTDLTQAAAAGVLTGTGAGGAVAIHGWRNRVRRALGRRERGTP